MASDAVHRIEKELAAAARIPGIFRHDPWRGELLRSGFAPPRQRADQAGKKLLLHRRDWRACGGDDWQIGPRAQTILPVRRVHRAPLAAPRATRGHREI